MYGSVGSYSPTENNSEATVVEIRFRVRFSKTDQDTFNLNKDAENCFASLACTIFFFFRHPSVGKKQSILLSSGQEIYQLFLPVGLSLCLPPCKRRHLDKGTDVAPPSRLPHGMHVACEQ